MIRFKGAKIQNSNFACDWPWHSPNICTCQAATPAPDLCCLSTTPNEKSPSPATCSGRMSAAPPSFDEGLDYAHASPAAAAAGAAAASARTPTTTPAVPVAVGDSQPVRKRTATRLPSPPSHAAKEVQSFLSVRYCAQLVMDQSSAERAARCAEALKVDTAKAGDTISVATLEPDIAALLAQCGIVVAGVPNERVQKSTATDEAGSFTGSIMVSRNSSFLTDARNDFNPALRASTGPQGQFPSGLQLHDVVLKVVDKLWGSERGGDEARPAWWWPSGLVAWLRYGPLATRINPTLVVLSTLELGGAGEGKANGKKGRKQVREDAKAADALLVKRYKAEISSVSDRDAKDKKRSRREKAAMVASATNDAMNSAYGMQLFRREMRFRELTSLMAVVTDPGVKQRILSELTGFLDAPLPVAPPEVVPVPDSDDDTA